MRIQTDAVNVVSRASSYLLSGLLKRKPLWFDVVAKYPPKQNLIKVPYIQSKENKDPRNDQFELKKRDRKRPLSALYQTRASKMENGNLNRKIHRIPKLKFLEDEIRDYFHLRHPWENARPKTLVENSGDEVLRKCDWSRMLQLYKPLDGESVVQRTMYILQNDPEVKDVFEAYDIARFEYYKLRMAEEMESHVAKEESVMHGAVFESTHLDWNLTTEQKYIDEWVKIASEKTQVLEANRSKSNAPAGSMGGEEVEAAQVSIFEDFLQTGPSEGVESQQREEEQSPAKDAWGNESSIVYNRNENEENLGEVIYV